MKKVYIFNYLLVLVLCGLIFYFLQKYVSLPILYNYLIAINLAAFIIFGLDKFSAGLESERVPELVLHAFSLLGGFIGSFLGMVYFHHKTKKIAFTVVPLIGMIIYLALFYYFPNVLPTLTSGY